MTNLESFETPHTNIIPSIQKTKMLEDHNRILISNLETIPELSQCSSDDCRLSSFSFTDNSKQRYNETLDPQNEEGEEEEDKILASRYDDDECIFPLTQTNEAFVEGRIDVNSPERLQKSIPEEAEESEEENNSTSDLSSSSVVDILALDMVILGRLFCTLWRDPHQLLYILKEDYSKLSDKIVYQPEHKKPPPKENRISGLRLSLLEDSRTSDQPQEEISTTAPTKTNNVEIGVFEDELKRLQDVNDLMEQEMAELEDINYALSVRIVELKNELKRVSFQKDVLEEQNRLLSSAVARNGAL